MRVVLVAGGTRTASIPGISAAGADPELMRHTPAADAEILAYGRPVAAPTTPVSPTGCPTPAVVSRAVHELLETELLGPERLDPELLVVDAGLAKPTAAPTVVVGDDPGGDVREADPVPNAGEVFAAARDLAGGLPDEELVVGETIPGGTTTALGVLRALGEPYGVSSSLPENPLPLKEATVDAGMEASGLDPGGAASDPVRAVRRMGDPVQAAVAGLAVGALERGATVTLAGGTQMVAAGALVRHAGVEAPLGLATTSFVVEDDSADVAAAARALDLDLAVTDPGFDRADNVAMERYRLGEAKEGVGMGGALHLADRAGVPMADVRERIERCYERVVGDDGP